MGSISDLRCLGRLEEKSVERPQPFYQRLTPRHTRRPALTFQSWRLSRAQANSDPAPTQSPLRAGRLRLGQGSGGTAPRESGGVASGGRSWLRIGCPTGPRAGLRAGSRSAARRQLGGGAGGSPAANGRAAPEQLQRAGARPLPLRGRWGEARFAEARRRPGRAGPQAVAAGSWRRQPLLRVPGCSSSCWRRRQRWFRRQRVSSGAAGLAGDRGVRGPGLASGSLLLFLKHGAGPGAQVVAPGPGFPGGAAATRAAGGERRPGGGVCPSLCGRAGQSPVSASRVRWRRAVQSEVGGCPLGRSGHGPRGVRVAGTGRAGAAPPLPRWGAVWRCPGHPTSSGLLCEAPGPGAGLGSEEASRAGCEL